MKESEIKKLDLMDALDLAIFIEQEAEERYKLFYHLIGERFDGDAGSFFDTMSHNEAKHAHQLKQKRTQLFGQTPIRISPMSVWNIEAPEENLPRPQMSIAQAFQIALDAEKKAWEFFDKSLKFVLNEDVKNLFEELRDEEMLHKELLENQMKKLNISQKNELKIEFSDTEETPFL